MKMLTTFVLLCAGMVLTNAAAVPEAEPDQMTGEASIQEGELLLNFTVPEAEPHEEMTGEALIQEDDAVFFSGGCPRGWDRHNDRCFRYVESAKPWALAERHCRHMGATLASIHSHDEEIFVKGLILTFDVRFPATWIGGSDANFEGYWLWSDGSYFAFTNWCHGEPNNYWGNQDCIQMNYGGGKCWNDINCNVWSPFVCARRAQSSFV